MLHHLLLTTHKLRIACIQNLCKVTAALVIWNRSTSVREANVACPPSSVYSITHFLSHKTPSFLSCKFKALKDSNRNRRCYNCMCVFAYHSFTALSQIFHSKAGNAGLLDLLFPSPPPSLLLAVFILWAVLNVELRYADLVVAVVAAFSCSSAVAVVGTGCGLAGSGGRLIGFLTLTQNSNSIASKKSLSLPQRWLQGRISSSS